MPAVVRSDEELVEANSKRRSSAASLGFVGAVPAAAAVHASSTPRWPAGPRGVRVRGAAGLALRLPGRRSPPTPATPVEKAELRSPGVLLAAGAMGLLRGIVGFLTLYCAFHFRADRPTLAAFGVVAAVSVLGTLVGSVLAPRLRAWPRSGSLLTAASPLVVARPARRPVLGGVVGAAVLGVVRRLAATAGKLAFDSIVQRDAPDANRGRLFAKFETRFQLIWVFGSLCPADSRSRQLRVSSSPCASSPASPAFLRHRPGWRGATAPA